ncbi:MAG: chalcone isomerase family protein [Planctomycetota bacterium]|nr:chalcone isomerase family protein [Planctomycetota bacterium]
MRILAVLALAALPALAALTPQDGPAKPIPTVEEPSTEVRFPIELQIDKQTRHQLAGMGVRVKKKFLMKFKVYALGFYIDESTALEGLRKAAGDLTVKKLQDSDEFRKALLTDGFGRSIRLVMVRDVDADTMAEAFEDSLWPRMEAAVEATKEATPAESAAELAAAKASLATFRGFFEKEAEEDQVMDFTWTEGGRLQAVVDGKRFPQVKNLHLCQALFDVYLGDDPISDQAKANIYTALHTKLHPPTTR